MARHFNNMDETIAALSALAEWVSHSPLPCIPYVGPASGSIHDPPAPHVELLFVAGGEARDL